MAGRGGRGAALLKALEESKRRPGEQQEERPDVPQAARPPIVPPPTVPPQRPIGRGALFQTLLQKAEPKEVGAEPPKFLGRGVIRRPASAASAAISRPEEQASRSDVAPVSRGDVAPVSRPMGPGGDVMQQFAKMEVAADRRENPPAVMKHGEMGQRQRMTTNYIRLRVTPGMGIFEYAVIFNPQVDSRNMKFHLIRDQEGLLGKTRVFDGAKLYLPTKLPDVMTILTGSHPADPSLVVTIYIKYITQRRYEEAIHFYNVIFKRIANVLKMTRVGRNYFDAKAGISIPQHKLEVWPGYVTHVDEYEGGLMLMCDVSHRVIRTATVLETLQEIQQRTPQQLQENATRALLGCVIMTRYNNKTYRIDEIDWRSSPRSTFPNSSGEQVSYMTYYKKAHNLDILDDGQPMLIHRMKKKVKGEDRTDLICLVPELAVMTGLTDEMRSDFKVMKDIASHTRITPMQRQYAYRKFVENVKSNKEAREKLTDWGLVLDDDTIQFEGRELNREKIILKSRRFPTNDERDWGREVTRDHVLNAVALNHWCVIHVNRDKRRCADFVEMMHKVCPAMGIQVKPPRIQELSVDRNEAFVTAVRECVTPELQVVVIIFPTMREDRYNAVKKIACCEKPIPSQVINSRTISQPQKLRSVTQKIALQINCKLGGELWALEIPLKKLMVCGIDVYHDKSRNGRSVAGFVSSINPTLTRWYSRSCFQEPHQELVDGLRVCLIGALKKFYDINHTFPDRIVIFRDGVGDGQLAVVRDYEVEQLRKAFTHFGADYDPKLSVVVVQKRINTRLFTVLNHTGQLGNPPAGTVMDNTITRRNAYDFFLVSQHVRQGTVSPTHYIVVHDTNNLKPDHMQALSYKLTHLYYNWPGTVRVPAPCQYAHKLASLVGQNLHQEASSSLADRLFFL